MDRLRIVGGRPLEGTVRISGAKNASLPDLCATLLTDQAVRLRNVPEVRDIRTLARLLTDLGASVTFEVGGVVETRAARITSVEAPYELVKTMRASVLVLGPLLARCGRARVSLPGGCAIGARPINLHLQALEKMGARIRVESGFVEAECDRLRGTEIYFDTVTVTGTENVMMAAALADGETVVRNAACEPEITDLAELLNAMGARIQGAGGSTLRIEGVTSLRGAEHKVVPDRIETGTFVAACAIAGGDVEIRECHPPHLRAVIEKMRETGVRIEEGPDNLRVRSPRAVKASSVSTLPYPGFPTDMQAQYMALMTQATGTCTLTETIFENRYMHVAELQRMGASVRVEGRTAIVT
ncbi:MAG TPA: UDP-N-acetylglucosamine 1-carboxyvinyltransferase, partial [Vicinamibacteria bacterium]|nr:UDP-N-acetylglucosamine 1-carboxyvinyltransferase [Vicinamibacteria bacterium]